MEGEEKEKKKKKKKPDILLKFPEVKKGSRVF
jgi:hypothetical protein